MRIVNIYIGTDSASTRKSKKRYGFVMECFVRGEERTKETFGESEGTFHRVVLEVICKALERMKEPCEIHLYTEDVYVLNMIDNCLEKWKANGFRTSKDKLVKNEDLWQQYDRASREHLIKTEYGVNQYLSWIKEEIERRKNNV